MTAFSVRGLDGTLR